MSVTLNTKIHAAIYQPSLKYASNKNYGIPKIIENVQFICQYIKYNNNTSNNNVICFRETEQKMKNDKIFVEKKNRKSKYLSTINRKL